MKIVVYVDGFNLYYGALKKTKHRWLDVMSMAKQLYPSDNIVKVKYFTARVSGQQKPDAPRKQAIYLKALRQSGVELFMGSYLSKMIWRPIVNLPVGFMNINTLPHAMTLPVGNHVVDQTTNKQVLQVGNYPKKGGPRLKKTPLINAVLAEVHTMEEKGSDVNLAAHLLNDAWEDLYDKAAVISNDTDLIEPISMVSKGRKKEVEIICPNRDNNVAPKLVNVATRIKYIRPPLLRSSQFPDPIMPSGLAKPIGW